MTRPLLYDYELDQNAYKARLLLAILELDYDKRAIDMFPGKENFSDQFLRLNPLGELPILVDGTHVVAGGEAVLVYLAQKHDGSHRWMPQAPEDMSAVVRWLGFSASELRSAVVARNSALFDEPRDASAAVVATRRALRIMENHLIHRQLDGKTWFATRHATIADLALFPAFALCRDFGIEHGEFPALRKWLRTVREIEGFIPMPGVPGYH